MSTKSSTTELLKQLRQGTSKSELYEKYKNQIDEQSLRLTLASRPSQKLFRRYRFLQLTIATLWLIFALLELLGSIDLFYNFDLDIVLSLLITFYLCIQIWRFNANVFLPGALWLLYAAVSGLMDIRHLQNTDPDYGILITISLAYPAILIITASLMLWLKRQVFSYYHWFRPAKAADGQILFELSP